MEKHVGSYLLRTDSDAGTYPVDLEVFGTIQSGSSRLFRAVVGGHLRVLIIPAELHVQISQGNVVKKAQFKREGLAATKTQ